MTELGARIPNGNGASTFSLLLDQGVRMITISTDTTMSVSVKFARNLICLICCFVSYVVNSNLFK